ncbi:hypothetical protein [Chryseobacterium aureum]|uniref:hypothetical protein n=1 Tax=Chryseobacterium aureum TaxID=2497456 RepID=UPI000F8823DD|nr:hypothetical protein [Chryseobacterium aureum]
MKNSLIISFLIAGNSIFAQAGNFGINTNTPTAKVDIVSTGNSSSTKALRISDSGLLEKFTLLNNGNMGINSTSPDAQLGINTGVNTKSVLKVNPVSTTNGKQNPGIDYNSFSPLISDENGHVMKQFDLKTGNSNSLTFDGSYTTSGATNKTLCSVNSGSILGFTVLTGFVQGQNGTGVVKYATVTWSRGSGFIISSSGYDFANNNPNSLTIQGSGTNTLTFDVQTGDDLIFEVTGGNLVYRQVDSSSGTGRSEGFSIFKSFRTR